MTVNIVSILCLRCLPSASTHMLYICV